MTFQMPVLPAPKISPEVAHYWDSAGAGRLVVRTCKSCGELHHYPRTACPFCFSRDLDWQEVSGAGVIYSYSIMRRAPVPYAIAYITLAEGVTMLSNIVDADFDSLHIGMNVKVDFAPTTDDGPMVPVFRPA